MGKGRLIVAHGHKIPHYARWQMPMYADGDALQAIADPYAVMPGNQPDRAGLHLWSGEVTPTFGGVVWVGEWRDLTPEEAAHAASGVNPLDLTPEEAAHAASGVNPLEPSPAPGPPDLPDLRILLPPGAAS